MLVTKEIVKLLKGSVTVPVYNGYVPENMAPAIAFNNLDYSNTRVLSGNASGNTSEHRISVVTKNDAELDDIVKELLLLDNTDNDDFQRILIAITSIEPLEMSSPLRRCFLQLTVYNK